MIVRKTEFRIEAQFHLEQFRSRDIIKDSSFQNFPNKNKRWKALLSKTAIIKEKRLFSSTQRNTIEFSNGQFRLQFPTGEFLFPSTVALKVLEED